jgi:hypothetical protein
MCEDRPVPGETRDPITIALTPLQVEEVLRAATRDERSSIQGLLTRALADSGPGYPEFDRRLSRSLLRGLAVLAYLGGDGRARGIVEMARELGMSASTTHRYAATLIELGLLERSPRTRKYRLSAELALERPSQP